MSAEIAKQKDHLNNLFIQVRELDYDLEMQAHWAKYLCVLVSGFIETSVRVLLSDYAGEKSSPKVAKYVSRQLRGLQNVNSERLLSLFGAFDPNWRNDLEEFINGEIKEAIDSIVANKNNIAHGQHVGLTYIHIRDWHKKTLDLIGFIEEELVS